MKINPSQKTSCKTNPCVCVCVYIRGEHRQKYQRADPGVFPPPGRSGLLALWMSADIVPYGLVRLLPLPVPLPASSPFKRPASPATTVRRRSVISSSSGERHAIYGIILCILTYKAQVSDLFVKPTKRCREKGKLKFKKTKLCL